MYRQNANKPDRRKNSEYFKEQQKVIEERMKYVSLTTSNYQ